MEIARPPAIQAIEPEIATTVADFDYELVQIASTGRRGRRQLMIYIDRPGGVTSDDCARMAERLSLLLERLEPVPDYASLTVSSPGVERPLTNSADFDRFAGQTAAITTRSPRGKKITRTGVIQQVHDEQVSIACGGQACAIPLADIIAAHLVYEWDEQ